MNIDKERKILIGHYQHGCYSQCAVISDDVISEFHCVVRVFNLFNSVVF